jgi:Transposase and inactivated derivatives
MFALNSSMTYFMCPRHIDLRKGMYSLYQLVKSEMRRNPLSGEVYIFYGKSKETIKILHWQKDGFVLYIKKLERGTFEIPSFNHTGGNYEMKWSSFVLIMEGISVSSVKYRKRFTLE